MNHLNKFVNKELVIGMSNLCFKIIGYVTYEKNVNKYRLSLNRKLISTNRLLQLLHVDIFGSSRFMSFCCNYYTIFIMDDYSHYSLTIFLSHKKDVFIAFHKLAKVIQNEKGIKHCIYLK